ncbi:Ig-like domain-containing protein, partial [Pseudoalteromonas fuliginea]|uniref:Ig-like domain-containing protein n=1 Tax=Pseudoalteromonas fuliginea TaxID=1872678 RepID=UPI0005FA22E0
AVAVDGNWSVDFSAAGLEDGELSVSAVAQDAAGNTSAPATASLSLDTTAPDDPVITNADASSLIVTGTAEVGSTVSVTVGVETLSA